MSFSAHKPCAPTVPSALTSPSRRATAATDGGKHAPDTHAGAGIRPESEVAFAINAADLAAVPEATPSYMLPPDAPGQGVWYDGNPFQSKGRGGRGVTEGAESGLRSLRR